MRVLLVSPPIERRRVYGRFFRVAPNLPPLGICYLASILLQDGHQVEVADCSGERKTWGDLRKRIEGFSPHVVGITSTTVAYSSARELIRRVKEFSPEVRTILGGAHISALPDATMAECDRLDIGVVGEGEQTMSELLGVMGKGGDLTRVKGIIFRDGRRAVRTPARGLIPDLDSIPFPARHLLKDLRHYSHTPFRGHGFTTSMISSRGCPYSCSFCDQTVFGKRWRAHSPDYVLEEMALIKKDYGVQFISFEDDNFLVSRERVVQISERLITSGLDLRWGCSVRERNIDKDVLHLMRRAGCRVIYLGIETASPRLLGLMKKEVSTEEMKKTAGLVKGAGIDLYGSFILGLPTETEEETKETIALAVSLPLDGASFFLYTPYPNTGLREEALASGTVSSDWGDYSAHPNRPAFLPGGLSRRYLLKTQYRAYREFLLRPGYLATHIKKLLNMRFILRILGRGG